MKKCVLLVITFILLWGNGLYAKESASNKILLDKNWSYAVETNQKSITSFDAKPDQNKFKSISFSEFSHLENLLPHKSGVIWLKVSFYVPQDYTQENLSCNLGRISMHDQTWMNGVYLGGWGTFTQNSWSYWNKIRAYKIPGFLIHAGVTNTIYIRVFVDQEGSITKVPEINDSSIIYENVVKSNFIHSTSYIIIAAILLLLCIYHVYISTQRKTENIHLIYALITLVTVLYTSKFYLSDLPGLQFPTISNVHFQKIICYAPIFVLLFLAGDFYAAFFEKKMPKIVYIVRIFFLIIPLFFIFEAHTYAILLARNTILFVLTLPLFVYILYLIFSSINIKNKQAVTILWSFSPLIFTGTFDSIMHLKFHLSYFPFFSQWAWQIVVIIQFFILSAQIEKTRKNIEDTKTKLENKIQIKDREISIKSDNLQAVQNCINIANKQKEQALTTASYVLRKSTLSEIPAFKEWDIAYYTDSKTNIPSTICDFFMRGKTLAGIEFFDFHNHDISSVLMAMFTKNIIQSCFYNGSHVPLNKIMQQINKNITTDNKALTQCVSGILLRITDDRIEYVNASHPDILHISGKTGKVRPVTLSSENIRGDELGKSLPANTYKSLAFSMKENDSLFIYTDSLVQSQNNIGEKFGTDRIITSLFENSLQSPTDTLSKIKANFQQFCGNTTSTKDLKMLIIQRK